MSNQAYKDASASFAQESVGGTFAQPDPYGGSYNFSDPQSLNRYSYTTNDPVNFRDPSGLNYTYGFFGLPRSSPRPELAPWYTSGGRSGGGRGTSPPYVVEAHERDHGGDTHGGDPSSNGEPQNSVPCPSVPTHPANADIKANITEAESHSAASVFNPAKLAVDAVNAKWFYNQVRNKGAWDYKQQGSQYQDFGNFNFGATGLATGLFNETVILAEAGRAQIAAGTSKPGWGYPPTLRHPRGQPPYGDDPADQVQIKAGFAYYYAVQKGCK